MEIVGGPSDPATQQNTTPAPYDPPSKSARISYDSLGGTIPQCDGHDGLYRPGGTPDRVGIRTDSLFIILRELGHAWESNSASDSGRQRLMDELDLEAWTGATVKYRHRGAERAANLIAWGLVERPLTETEIRTKAETLTRFASFTGISSPRLTE